MLIQSAYVEQFATLDGPLRVDFGESLTLIVGVNEAGKSTLMRAIWFALTRRAGSQAQEIRDIIPYSGGTPEVHVKLSQNGASYLLKKRFDANDDLTHFQVRRNDGTQKSWQGDAADRELRELLAFGEASGRKKTPSHFGMWPVTWVRQDESGIDPGERLTSEGDVEALTTSLSEITGDVLAGTGGADVLQKAEEEYSRYFTNSGNKTTRTGAPLHEAEQELEAVEAALADLEEQQETYERDIEQYRQCDEELRVLKERLPTLKEEAENAREKAERVETLRGELETASTEAESAEKEVERRQEHLDTLEKLRSKIDELEETLDEAEAEQAKCREALKEHRARRPELKQQLDDAEGARDEAAQRAAAADAHLTVLQEDERLGELEEKLEQASTHQEERADVKGKLSNLTVDEDTLEKLEELSEDVRDADAALQAAAAKIELQGLEEDVAFEVDGQDEQVGAGERHTRQIEARTEIKIGETVQIDVVPGGEDLDATRKQAGAAKEALQEALDEAQVDSLKEARQAQREKERLEGEGERIDELIELHAPEGIEALQEERAAAEQRKEDAVADLEDIDADAEDTDRPDDLPAAREKKQALQEEKEEAAQAFEEAREQWQEHDSKQNELESDLRLAEQAAQTARDQLAASREEAEEIEEERGNREALEAHLEEAEETLETAEARVAELEKELREIGADQIDEEKERAEDALEAAEREQDELRERQIELKTKLSSADLHGLHGKLSEKRQEEVEAQEKVERMERRAEAARLLYETLQEKRSSAQRRHQAPLREEIRTLLTRFFRVEDGSVQLGEDFDLQSVSRSKSGQFAFDQLSGGAKEQMGLLVRLAMAGIIAEGEPLPVFLDEPLSDTDDGRFKAMATVLRSRAEDMQIIVTTCYRDRYRQLGAPSRIDLGAAKSRSHTPPSLQD